MQDKPSFPESICLVSNSIHSPQLITETVIGAVWLLAGFFSN